MAHYWSFAREQGAMAEASYPYTSLGYVAGDEPHLCQHKEDSTVTRAGPSVQVTTPNCSGSGSSCSGKKYETSSAVFSHPSSRACGVFSGMGSEVDLLEIKRSSFGSLRVGTDVGICATESVTMRDLLAL